MSKMFTSWSYSRYSDWRNCPRKARLKHLDKVPTKPSEALARGLAVHKAMEAYIKKEADTAPAHGAALALATVLRDAPHGLVQVEAEWAFKADWSATHWRDWTECACRMKLDVSYDRGEGEIRIYDWKTGKKRKENNDQYNEQLDLFALGALLMLPRVKVVIPQLVYLDTDEVYPEEPARHTRADVDTLKRTWGARIAPMLADREFIPRPNFLCNYCDYRKAAGGPCEF